MVSNICYVYPLMGKWSNLTSMLSHPERCVFPFFRTTWLCHQILCTTPTTHPCMVWYQCCLHFYHKHLLQNVGKYTIFMDVPWKINFSNVGEYTIFLAGMGIPNLHFTTWVGVIFFFEGTKHTLRQEPENSLGWTQNWVGAFRSKQWWRGDRCPRDPDP